MRDRRQPAFTAGALVMYLHCASVKARRCLWKLLACVGETATHRILKSIAKLYSARALRHLVISAHASVSRYRDDWVSCSEIS